MKGLRGKLTATNCIIISICLLIMVFISYRIAADEINRVSISEYEKLSEKMAQELDKWLTSQECLVRNNTSL